MATHHGASGAFGPAVAIGVGLGAFVDGIVFHQLLGWHHLLSSRAGVSMRANEVADGIFHTGSWFVVLVGVVWLYARLRQPVAPAAWPRLGAGPRPWRALFGPVLIGWGLFNVIEGLVNHQVLRLHHVRPGPGQLGWDLGFLAFGAVVTGAGFVVARSGRGVPIELPVEASEKPAL